MTQNESTQVATPIGGIPAPPGSGGVVNTSYLSSIAELWNYTDKSRVLENATSDDSLDPMASPIPDATQDIITTAMNWGRTQIDNFLRRVYNVNLANGLVISVTATSPGEAVKLRNARLTLYKLQQKRLPMEQDLDLWRKLKEDLKDLQRANAEEILGEDAERTDQVLPVGSSHEQPETLRDSNTAFDSVPDAPWSDPRLIEPPT
jgi:hypothetical protein